MGKDEDFGDVECMRPEQEPEFPSLNPCKDVGGDGQGL